MNFLFRCFFLVLLCYIFLNPISLALSAATSRHWELGWTSSALFFFAFVQAVVRGGSAWRGRFTSLLIVSGCVFAGLAHKYRLHEELQLGPLLHVPFDQPVALVTGGSKGIGWATTQQLVNLGFSKVIVVSRSPPPINRTNVVDWIQADLSTLAAVDDAVAEITKRSGGRLDAVVINAGIASGGPDTHEISPGVHVPYITAVNFVCQARLLHRLIPLIINSGSSSLKRVAIVSSLANSFATDEAVLAPLTESHGLYAVTKALQVVHAKHLSKHYPSLHIVSVTPGACATDIGFGEPTSARAQSVQVYGTESLFLVAPLVQKLTGLVTRLLFEDVSVGAERVVYALLDHRVPSGSYVNNFGQLNVLVTPLASNETAIATVVKNLSPFL